VILNKEKQNNFLLHVQLYMIQQSVRNDEMNQMIHTIEEIMEYTALPCAAFAGGVEYT
jgi:2-keto-4-pentenoate hydratase/2-oxohepta-3-ene-1,7-dioic acid hydratase in catechol pathway